MCKYDDLPRVPSTADLKERIRVDNTSTSTTNITTSSNQNDPLSSNHHHHHHHQDAAAELTSDAACGNNYEQRPFHCTMRDSSGGNHTAPLSAVAYILLGMCVSAAVTLFSLYFPFWLAPEAASKTYFLAFYHYEKPGEWHHFDTTAWTYGTDFGLAIVMSYWSYTMLFSASKQRLPVDNLCKNIWGLILGYAVSTTAGALAHLFYDSFEMRNTWHFRLLWTVCVGTVSMASLSMGCIGSEMARQFQPHCPSALPFVPEIFWVTFGLTTTLVCALGWFSYQRPACDIFIAGITQFPTSFYMITILWQAGKDLPAYIRPLYQWIGMASFILNAPLLPLYPLLVQYTNWSLAQVNTFLHTWLLITWSMQALSLRHVRRAAASLQQRPPRAVPILPAPSQGLSTKKQS